MIQNNKPPMKYRNKLLTTFFNEQKSTNMFDNQENNRKFKILNG